MSEKSKSTAFLLCYALGLFGVHRFYLGRWITGLLMLLTLGGLMFWWLIDSVLLAAGVLKDANGDTLRTGPPDPDRPWAGFWVRAAAWSVDALILNVGLSVLLMAVGLAVPLVTLGGLAPGAAPPEQMAEATALLMTAVTGGVTLLAIPLYFGLQTASRHQATVGKRCFELKVTTADGAPPGLGRAVGRSLGYFLSSLLLGIGYLMAAFTREKRALHDMLAGTRVVYAAAAPAAAATHPPPLVQPDAAATPHALAQATPAAAAEPPAAANTSSAADATVQRDTGVPTGLIVAGALLLAAAAALALLA